MSYIIGIIPTAVDTTPQFKLGAIGQTSDGYLYKYVQYDTGAGPVAVKHQYVFTSEMSSKDPTICQCFCLHGGVCIRAGSAKVFGMHRLIMNRGCCTTQTLNIWKIHL